MIPISCRPVVWYRCRRISLEGPRRHSVRSAEDCADGSGDFNRRPEDPPGVVACDTVKGALIVHDAGLASTTSPLLRAAIEYAVGMHWLRQVWGAGLDAGVVQDIADAFSECPTFTSTDSDGEVSEVTVSPMSFSNLGDQTLAVAMTLESSMFTVSVNVAYVVIGHNVVAMVQGGIAGVDGAELEKLTKQAIGKLEKTVA